MSLSFINVGKLRLKLSMIWNRYVYMCMKNKILSDMLTRNGLDMYYLKQDMIKMKLRHDLHREVMAERMDVLTNQIHKYKVLYTNESIKAKSLESVIQYNKYNKYNKVNELKLENVRLKDELKMYKASEGNDQLLDNVTPIESPLIYNKLGTKNSAFLPPKY